MRLFATILLAVWVSAVQAGAEDVPRFGMFEKSFSHSGTYGNPYKDLTALATLRRPDGKQWSMPLFWDGEAAWMLRVSPDMVGEWSYSIRSPDAGLNARTGSFRCMESNRRGSIRPMRGHPLHFEYQDGTPFWFFGEKAWRVFQKDPAEKLDHTSAMHHVDVRAEQGFNYLHTELAGTGGLTSGGNEGGEMFLDSGKEIINPAFFQDVDSRLRHINQKGMICGMVLLYAKGDPSWKSLPDDEARLRFARYVVARYAAFDIVFLVTGEWHFMANQPDLFRAIGREILKTDPHGRMIGIHPGPESLGISSQEFAGDEWMSFGEYAQAYFAPHAREATEANRDDLRKFILAARKHNKPVVAAEYAYYLRDQDYDGVVDKPHSHTRDSFRRASWVIAMGGGYFVTGFGTTYFGGRREVGPFLVDNPRHKDAVCDLDHLHKFFTSLQWWLLEPHDEWVQADGGYAYCLADAGRTYVIYVAAGNGANLKLDGGKYSLCRYDPRTGQSTELLAAAGDLVRLVAPDSQDWVFLAKATVRADLATEKPPTAALSRPGAEEVQRWDTYERSLEATGSYTNPFQDVNSRKDPVHTQANLFAAGPDYTRYHVEAFRAIDKFIDTLRQADILASPYFYYDPRREVLWKMTPEQDRAYIRYGMARLGAFSNVMPVLGNEIELKTTNYKDPAFDLKSHAWANEMGAYLKNRVVFGQPVSVHNPCWHESAVNPSYFTLLRDWPFAGWTDFILKQAQVGCIGAAVAMSDSVPQPQEVIYNERSYARHNQVLIDLRRFNRPVINEEPAYDMGSKSAYASQTPETMRPTFWTAAAAGAYAVWGSKATYVTGDPLPQMKGNLTPQYMRVLHDVMADLPYAQMEPLNESVTPANVTLDGEAWRTNFALAKPGEVYLVYSLHGGTGTVTLAPGRYCALRVDPRDGTKFDLGAVTGGAAGFSLPQGDWVFIYRRIAGDDGTH